MEVHHHPDLHHKPKPWKEYLLEYLMIFLAVMTGFFAESYREHLSDRSKEQEYLTALVSELKTDTAAYNVSFAKISTLIPQLDSMYHNLNEPARYNYVLMGKWNTPINQTSIVYTPALAIIQQLKSSGNLRLIDKREIGLQIIKYETYIEGQYARNVIGVNQAANKLFDLEDALCDEGDFDKVVIDDIKHKRNNHGLTYDMPIKIRDAEKLNQFANSVVNYTGRTGEYVSLLNDAKKQATEILKSIQKEYNLKDE